MDERYRKASLTLAFLKYLNRKYKCFENDFIEQLILNLPTCSIVETPMYNKSSEFIIHESKIFESNNNIILIHRGVRHRLCHDTITFDFRQLMQNQNTRKPYDHYDETIVYTLPNVGVLSYDLIKHQEKQLQIYLIEPLVDIIMRYVMPLATKMDFDME